MDSNTATEPKATDEHLLEEYRLSQEYAIAMNQQIWQVGSILIGVSLAAFAFVVTKYDKANEAIWLRNSIMAGIGSTLLLWLWYVIMERLARFIDISYQRSREIEEHLGLWRNRYIHRYDQRNKNAQKDDNGSAQIVKLDTFLEDTKSRVEFISEIRTRTVLRTAIIIIYPTFWILWILLLKFF